MTKKTRVLVVEDEAITAVDIQTSLIGLGYDVPEIVMTEAAAVQKAEELKPDIILMDIMLAGPMTGIEAAEEIRKRLRIPVIYLTAFANDAILEKAKITEPYGYVLKPFSESEVRSNIEIALYKHRMDEMLLEKEETIRALLNATPDALFLLDKDGKFLALNDAMAHRLNKTVDEIIGTSFFDYLFSKLYPPKLVHFDDIVVKENATRFEEEFQGKWYESCVLPVLDDKKTMKKIAVFSHEITRQKKNEEQLRANEEYLRSLIENAADLTIVLKSGGKLSGVSTAFERITGYTYKESVGNGIWDYIHPEDLEKTRVIMDELLATPKAVKPMTMRLITKAGMPVIIEGLICNLLDNPVVGGIIFNGWERKSKKSDLCA
ncbi:MAG: two-component response regulator [Methanoregula sp. PtaU1.Bin051]|nr:MAG: two-component response regulator [Methanoregula sp. PtaU1.Bin051]